MATRLGVPSAGYANWSLRLLARWVYRIRACRVSKSGNDSTDIKKNGMTQRKIAYWIIPPKHDAEFVAHMEAVLEVYQRPYEANHAVIGVDKQPLQLVKETRPPTPIEATMKNLRRIDYESKRAGSANIFMFTEPLSGWRHAPSTHKIRLGG